MNQPLESVYVADLMHRNPITVSENDRIADVAKLFQHHQFNSAPVVDTEGKCVGFITSSDLVRFAGMCETLEHQSEHGVGFDEARYANEVPHQRFRYDQVAVQMTKDFHTVAAGVTLADAIATMCHRGLHHLLILDGLGKPYGILSSLDILGYLTGGRTEQS